MKLMTFPDGQSVTTTGNAQFAVQIKNPQGQTRVCWAMSPAHAWAKANENLDSFRVIMGVGGPGMPCLAIQTLSPGQRATMPGKYR